MCEKITSIEEFEEIMRSDENGGKKLIEPGCNALKGLLIITKYLPKAGIRNAAHEIIYSVTLNELLLAGITREDALELRYQNWMVEDDVLACFV